jgi:hypothetical protein
MTDYNFKKILRFYRVFYKDRIPFLHDGLPVWTRLDIPSMTYFAVTILNAHSAIREIQTELAKNIVDS